MRIPVFAVLPSQEPLRESANMALTSRRRRSLTNISLPDAIKLDTTFAALPIGPEGGDAFEAMALHTDQSDRFVVRGFIDVDDPSEIPERIGGLPIHSDPAIASFLTCGGAGPVGGAAQVRAKLNLAALHGRGLDGSDVAVAIMDTGINLPHLTAKRGQAPRFDAANSWRFPGTTTSPGTHPVDHGTMCAYDVLIAAPNATLLDFPILAGKAPGGAKAASTLRVAFLAYAQLIASWAIGYAPGDLQKYKALVVSNSWGVYHPSWDFPAGHPGRYIDNPNHPFTRQLSMLAQSADIIFAAGNCGAQCADGRCQTRTTGTIMGANASADVLTLAGCDTNDVRVGYSSQGPSIPPMFHDKPDVTSYAHFLGSEAFGAGSADSGTSAACPVAAGCVAALRTKALPAATPPAGLFAQLRATARPAAGQAGWNGDYGYGIMDPDAAAHTLGV